MIHLKAHLLLINITLKLRILCQNVLQEMGRSAVLYTNSGEHESFDSGSWSELTTGTERFCDFMQTLNFLGTCRIKKAKQKISFHSKSPLSEDTEIRAYLIDAWK